jgi:uncharacterized caspase-like protein
MKIFLILLFNILFLFTGCSSTNKNTIENTNKNYTEDGRGLYPKKHNNERKLALVVGNSNYNGKLSKLQNPTNDAKDVSNALKDLGFEVIKVTNANQKTMDSKLREFSSRLKSAGVGLFYYAGHGVSVENKNYLIPIDSDIKDEHNIKYNSLALNEVVDRMRKSKNRLNMIVLDACRNNPFNRSASGGLSSINADGIYIAYATSPNGVAKDNIDERNGMYTKHFLKHIKTPNINHKKLFDKIRESVYKETDGEQTEIGITKGVK